MKQYEDCTTIKKADNCIECAIKNKNKLKAVKEHLLNILKMPKKEYKKIEMIENLIFKGSLLQDL